MGYNYVGYKCLDPITDKVYLSRHVIFYETTFPTKESVASKLPSKLPGECESHFPPPESIFLPSLSLSITLTSGKSFAPDPSDQSSSLRPWDPTPSSHPPDATLATIYAPSHPMLTRSKIGNQNLNNFLASHSIILSNIRLSFITLS